MPIRPVHEPISPPVENREALRPSTSAEAASAQRANNAIAEQPLELPRFRSIAVGENGYFDLPEFDFGQGAHNLDSHQIPDSKLGWDASKYQVGDNNELEYKALPRGPAVDQATQTHDLQKPLPQDFPKPDPHQPLPQLPAAGRAKDFANTLAKQTFMSSDPGIGAGAVAPLSDANNVDGGVNAGLGGATSSISGAADVFNIFTGGKNVYQALRTKNDPKATLADKYQADQALAQARVDIPTQLGDVATQTTNLGATFGAGTAATNAAQAVPILGTIVSGAVATKAGMRANDAKNYRNNLDGVLTRLQDPSSPRAVSHEELVNTAQYARGQMETRYNNQSIGAAGATTAALGGVTTALSPLAGPAAPVVAAWGATLGVAGGAVATGVSVKQGLHYVQKQWAGTLGEERGQQANNLWNLLGSQDPATRQYAEDIVTSIGLDPNTVRSDPTKGREILSEQLKSS